jgi:hypothetical protein
MWCRIISSKTGTQRDPARIDAIRSDIKNFTVNTLREYMKYKMVVKADSL